jgi:hypothetical protein
MNISLDYDHTYTQDPELWNDIIKIMQAAGHRVYCVTARYHWESREVMDTVGKLCPVYFTERKAKKPYMLSLNILIDVWIDDTPQAILMNYELFHHTNH